MQTIKTIQEYQYLIDEVVKTEKTYKVKVDMSHPELDKAMDELNLEGVEVIIGKEYDEIKPLD